MNTLKKEFLWQFVQLMLSVFLIFFLSVGIGKETAELIRYMNNPEAIKPAKVWIIFWILGPICLGFWCFLWIWFKKSEKKCLDLFITLTKKD